MKIIKILKVNFTNLIQASLIISTPIILKKINNIIAKIQNMNNSYNKNSKMKFH